MAGPISRIPSQTGAANTADARGTEHGTAGFNGSENEPARGSGADGANQLASNGPGSSGAPGNASAFSQPDESNNPNAAFHPTHGGTTAEQPLDRANGGQSIKTRNTRRANPRSIPLATWPATRPPQTRRVKKPASLESNRMRRPVQSRLARKRHGTTSRNRSLTKVPRKGRRTRHQSRENGSLPRAETGCRLNRRQTLQTKQAGTIFPSRAMSQARRGPTGTQLQPVQTAQSEPNAANGQVLAKQAVPLQTEPRNQRCGSESTSDPPARPAVAPGSLLDQEEPAPATTHRDPAPTGMNPSAGNPLITPGSPAQTAQASSATTVHVSSARPLASGV